MKKALIIFVLVAVAGVVGYSIYYTVRSGALKEGVVTCLPDGKCYWTAHIHSYMVMRTCGEERTLPAEVGELTGLHTHEERNIFHWHDRLPYDNIKKTLIDAAPLKLGAAFSAVGIPFENGRLLGFKDGDACPKEGAGLWKMFVNGEPRTDMENYVWHDRDVIILIFDERTPANVAEEVKKGTITFPAFPTLGRG